MDDRICLKRHRKTANARSLLNKFSQVHLHSTLRDAHLFIFKTSVLAQILLNNNITSIKNDLVPLLLESQYRDEKAKRLGLAHVKDRLMGFNLSGNRNEERVSCYAFVTRTGFTARYIHYLRDR